MTVLQFKPQSLTPSICLEPALYLGPRDSSCVHQQLLLLANHLTVHQLYVCAQDKDVGGWHRSLVIQQLNQLSTIARS